MRLMGRRRWPKNPKYCGICFRLLQDQHGGAEIECSLLFADVRGSTTMAEGITPAAFSCSIARFYETAADVVVERDAIGDSFGGRARCIGFGASAVGAQREEPAD